MSFTEGTTKVRKIRNQHPPTYLHLADILQGPRKNGLMGAVATINFDKSLTAHIDFQEKY